MDAPSKLRLGGSPTAKDQTRLVETPFNVRDLPSAAKAATDFAALTARLEAAPFQNRF
jgi:hypothetical protein